VHRFNCRVATSTTREGEREALRYGARRRLASLEIGDRRDEALAIRRPDHLNLAPVDETVNADTGRQQIAVDPTLAVVGRYLRRSRRYLGMTQMQLAAQSGLSQSMISRAERGVAPAVKLERFLALCVALGRLFPLGACPHDHDCAWKPIRPVQVPTADEFRRWLEITAGEG
jgi:transcriptional regulator with XRE-family HTH domain